MLMRRGGEICAWSDVIAPREEDKHKHLWVSACEEEQISREENTNTALDDKEAFVCSFIWWVATRIYRVNCHTYQHKNTRPTLCRQLEGPRATFLRGRCSNGHKHTHHLCFYCIYCWPHKDNPEAVASLTLRKYFQADIQKSIPRSLTLFHPSS